MNYLPQLKIPACYMRGGTSKGVFFRLEDLPQAAQQPGPYRDALLMRIVGSPDPYQKQIDGMGGASSSTSKVVILSKSTKAVYDIDYLFGQVAIDKAFVDWSGNCGNLTAAVGSFAIQQGLLDPAKIPLNGRVEVRIWQQNISKTIIASIPVQNGEVQETGEFELDGVTFPAAEIPIRFLEPAEEGEDASAGLFPTGNLVDILETPDGPLKATLINSGIPTIFVRAEDIGYQGTELQEDINSDPAALAKFEQLRGIGALKMGLIKHPDEIASRQHTPKIAFVSAPKAYVASSGKPISDTDTNVLVRALSMGKLHHAMMGTAAVAIATAAAIPGTLVNEAVSHQTDSQVTFGHPSGVLTVGAVAECEQGNWTVKEVSMSRSARMLMEGWVRVPQENLPK